MLKISHISKTFNPGTVNEKKAIEDLISGTETGRFCNDHRLQWRWKVHAYSMQSAETFLTDTGCNRTG